MGGRGGNSRERGVSGGRVELGRRGRGEVGRIGRVNNSKVELRWVVGGGWWVQ